MVEIVPTPLVFIPDFVHHNTFYVLHHVRPLSLEIPDMVFQQLEQFPLQKVIFEIFDFFLRTKIITPWIKAINFLRELNKILQIRIQIRFRSKLLIPLKMIIPLFRMQALIISLLILKSVFQMKVIFLLISTPTGPRLDPLHEPQSPKLSPNMLVSGVEGIDFGRIWKFVFLQIISPNYPQRAGQEVLQRLEFDIFGSDYDHGIAC